MAKPVSNTTNELNVANFWLPPYGYSQAVVLVSGLWGVGLGLQQVKGGVAPPLWPVSGIALGLFIVGLIVVYIFLRSKPLLDWLAGIPLALCALLALTILTLIAGIVPQDPNIQMVLWLKDYGFNQIFNSWFFVFTLLLLLTNLGLATIRRLWPLKMQNTMFILFHLGIWITLASSMFGAGDIQRVRMIVPEKQATMSVFDATGNQVKMPFAIYLDQFILEEFPPTVMLADNKTGKSLWQKGDPIIELKEGLKTDLKHLQLRVIKLLPHARLGRDGYIGIQDANTPPAAMIEVKTASGIFSGWITRGGTTLLPKVLSVEGFDVIMAEARPKRFASKVLVATPDRNVVPLTVEVNQPKQVKDWTLYQNSYEQQIGTGSSLSIIEAVKDPWLPVVYTGIILTLLGSLYLLWQGNRSYAASW